MSARSTDRRMQQMVLDNSREKPSLMCPLAKNARFNREGLAGQAAYAVLPTGTGDVRLTATNS